MPIMIWIAAITEAGIQNWPDCGILLAIQFINASLGYYEIVKAGDAVAALKKSLKPLATVKRDGKVSIRILDSLYSLFYFVYSGVRLTRPLLFLVTLYCLHLDLRFPRIV